MNKIKIDNRNHVQNFGAPYIIAEIGANHNGDMDLAKEMILSAKQCGAHCVKFQSWTPDSLVSKEEYDRNRVYNDSPKKHFGSLREMVNKYTLTNDQHKELKEFCDSHSIQFASSPFSTGEADLLDDLGVPFFKIASMDINNLDFIRYVASKKKPIIISTGMANLSEIEKAVAVCNEVGNKEVILLHCISIYPPDYQDIHLNNITMLQKTFGLPVGFSDHTIGTSIPLASVALGVCIIEKHFTLDKELPGWDHEISADPSELSVICEGSQHINKALGNYKRTVSEAEESKKLKFRRSLVVKQSLNKGHLLTKEDLTAKRPGNQIPPDQIDFVIGRKINQDIGEDEVLKWEYL
ncbi:polysaccharide biosynthesis protein [Aquimarina aggregata]|uniref:Polysaccharide biosynthesis protein n=1 Tax=Aquimarina aggregata TaxID=1642818 RepID=A0A163BJ03_9FLAO|nr:N-acetylneuraminate synthase family protein [Aquimarina aggregata]KZS41447.1 polysaccharide biosynthesis protein [Aquimarina aggregata]